jgi:hypothetical protein
VKSQNVLQHQLRRVAASALVVTLYVKSDHMITLGQQAVSPSAKAAEKVYS